MAIDLLATGIEVGVVTTDLDAMVGFYENFLGLPHQADLEFPGGRMKRYAVGKNVVKLVIYDVPPPSATAPGGGRAQAGLRYFSLVVKSLSAAAAQIDAAGYRIVEPLTEFAAVPGMGWLFVADPDGNWVELVGPI